MELTLGCRVAWVARPPGPHCRGSGERCIHLESGKRAGNPRAQPFDPLSGFATLRRPVGWAGRPANLSCAHARPRESMPTVNQLVRKGPRLAQGEDEDACPPRRPAEARCLHARVHAYAEEAELRAAQGRARPADERHGGHDLHPGRGPQPAGALGRARSRRPRQATCRASATRSIRAALDTAGVGDRRQGRSKYGAKKAELMPRRAEIQVPRARSGPRVQLRAGQPGDQQA